MCEKFNPGKARIFFLYCRDLPLPRRNFHVIASTRLNGMKKLIQFVKTHFFLLIEFLWMSSSIFACIFLFLQINY